MAANPHFNPWQLGGWFYRPLFSVAFRGMFAAFGLNPLLWHITTIAFHLANSYLVFQLIRRLRFGRAAAACGMLLFGLYPLSTECVSWLSAFSGIMAAFLSLLACLMLLYDRIPTVPRTALSFIIWLAACLAKQEAAALAFVMPFLPLLLNPKRGRGDYIRSFARAGLFGMGLAGLCILERHATHGLGNPGAILDANILTLAARHAVWTLPKMLEVADMSNIFAVGAALTFPVLLWKRYPETRPGLLWALGTSLGIGLALGHIGPADRYAYFPSIGLALCTAAMIERIAGQRERLDLAGTILVASATFVLINRTFPALWPCLGALIVIWFLGTGRREKASGQTQVVTVVLAAAALKAVSFALPYAGMSVDLSGIGFYAPIVAGIAALVLGLPIETALCAFCAFWIRAPWFFPCVGALTVIEVIRNGLTYRRRDTAGLGGFRWLFDRAALVAIGLIVLFSLGASTLARNTGWRADGERLRAFVQTTTPVVKSLPRGAYLLIDDSTSVAATQDPRIYTDIAFLCAGRQDLVIDRPPLSSERPLRELISPTWPKFRLLITPNGNSRIVPTAANRSSGMVDVGY